MGGSGLFLQGLPAGPGGRLLNLGKIPLKPSLYVAGQVQDEAGRPIPNVKIEGMLRMSRGYGYIKVVQTDDQGAFEVFDFPPADKRREGERGQVAFSHDEKVAEIIPDVYALTPRQRESLSIIMARGQVLRGQVLSKDGKPVEALLVEAFDVEGTASAPATRAATRPAEAPNKAWYNRRKATTDEQGRFTLRGLPPGTLVLSAYASDLKEKAQMQVTLGARDQDVVLRLEPVKLSAAPQTFSLLGMKVADLTPELAKLYDCDVEHGVLILDPGKHHDRLGIGALAEGYCFFMVGHRRISNLREMVDELLRIQAIDPPSRGGMVDEGFRGMIRVVYDSGRRRGTNTQYIKLIEDDEVSLRELAKTLKKAG